MTPNRTILSAGLSATALAIAATMTASLPARASSADAWEAFRKDVGEKCEKAGAPLFKKVRITVDPTGSDRFGLALMWGRSKDNGNPVSVICVYDKTTKSVELGSLLSSEDVRVKRGKPGTDQAEED